MLLTSCSYMFKKSYKINAPEPQLYFATGEELKMATAIYDGDLHSIQSNDELRHDGFVVEEWSKS